MVMAKHHFNGLLPRSMHPKGGKLARKSLWLYNHPGDFIMAHSSSMTGIANQGYQDVKHEYNGILEVI